MSSLRPVTFTELGDWSPSSYRSQFVWVAFSDRLVATGERHGPDNHAGIWSADMFLQEWSFRLTERGWEWIAPLIERLGAGEDPVDIEFDARQAYAQHHDGATAPHRVWNIQVDRG